MGQWNTSRGLRSNGFAALQSGVPSSPQPTVRSLARSLGLSHTTVSDALRGVGRVDPATAQRIRQAANAVGYRCNPLASSLMSELRRARGGTFRGVLAVIDIHEPDRLAIDARFHQQLAMGARLRATELGYNTEAFVVGRASLTPQRLDGILQSRGIHGVILLPVWATPDWSMLNWARYAGVYLDFYIERPALPCVCFDHYRAIITVLTRLAALGYQRPGLFVREHQDERIQHRFSGAFLGFQNHALDVAAVPPLITPEFQQADFNAWFREHQPDVVISHCTEAIGWMKACGARIPQTHGFVSLNLLYKTRPCAGLDQQPRKIGAYGAELVIAQLQRNERGMPASPTTLTIPGRWVDGPTLRRPHSVGIVGGMKQRS